VQGLNVEVVGSRFEENLDKEKLGPVPYVTATALGKANEGCLSPPPGCAGPRGHQYTNVGGLQCTND
jgi:predicted house-cleaning NTP pyrophosphatase (Maf/HAM1 superfamily)